MNGILKSAWVSYTKRFGRTILHPQYITNSYQYAAIIEAKKRSKKTTKLVDIGCGRMPYREELESSIEKYVGVDHPNVSKLYIGTIKPDVLADAHHLPFKNNSFNIALMLQMIEYLDDPQKALSECCRVLAKKGVLIATVPFFYPIHDIPYDRGRYTKSTLHDWLKKAGFSHISIISQGVFIETWLQMLSVWLFKTIEHLIAQDGLIGKIVLLFVVLLTPFIILFSNVVVFICRQVISVKNRASEYFPLNYIIVAIK